MKCDERDRLREIFRQTTIAYVKEDNKTKDPSLSPEQFGKQQAVGEEANQANDRARLALNSHIEQHRCGEE